MSILVNRLQVIELIKNLLIAAIRDTGNRGFNLSQSRCPVITGYLKSTGSGRDIDGGFKLKYGADYSCIYPKKTIPRFVVSSNNGKIGLNRLKPGILLSNGFGANNEVIAIDKKKVIKPKLYKVTTESGKEAILTDNHVIPTNNKGLIQVKDLSIGDELFTKESTRKKSYWLKCRLGDQSKRFLGRGNPRFGMSWHPKYSGGGYREDIGHYVRSSWEANLARVFQFIKKRYAYEAKRFYTEDCSYCPEYWLLDEDIYIELGVLAIKKRNGFFQMIEKILEANPELNGKLFFIDDIGYRELEKVCKGIIPNWELKK